MKCRLLIDTTGTVTPEHPDGRYIVGTVIDHADAWRLVRRGAAEPADEECERRAGLSKEMLLRTQYAYQRVHVGIHPDDYPAYDAGQMIGYNPDGSWIPGPAAETETEESESQLWIPEEYGD